MEGENVVMYCDTRTDVQIHTQTHTYSIKRKIYIIIVILIVVMIRRISFFTIINLVYITRIGITLNLLLYKVTYKCFIEFIYRDNYIFDNH